MFWLGLLLPVCYVATYTGAAIPTQYPVLSMALGAALWRSGDARAMAPLLASIAWAALSLIWTVNFSASVYGLWVGGIWGLSFWLGTTLDDLSGLWKGLAIGLSVSSAVAVGQWLGWNAVPSIEGHAGLLYNTAAQGAAIAIVILGAWGEGLWRYIPAMIPGLIISGSRGAFLILAVGALARVFRLPNVISLVGVAGLVLMFRLSPSDAERLQIWSVAISGLSWLGSGIGSFGVVSYRDAAGGHYPGFVHNDYLQLWFELGVGSVGIYLVLAAAAVRRSKESPVVVAILACAAFYFPVYSPIQGFVLFVLAGHCLRGFCWLRAGRELWRSAARLCGAAPEHGRDTRGGTDISVQSDISGVQAMTGAEMINLLADVAGGTVKQSDAVLRPQMSREDARALCDAGYMSVGEYLRFVEAIEAAKRGPV